ncbi:TetR/AcrR family transcriptional regulator [Cupriavidus oxalaticus]|uniref:TetR/AcrR family transcriptional regulator n=1 Tax=Cupriavidus oxalaticus TaxID=96344 RepID=UPI00317927A9
MGHSQTQKQQTHDRIVEIAAQRFRELGLNGLSIANLMKEAGQTHGGFYKHFESRDDLVAEALATAFASSNSEARTGKSATFKALVMAYLSKRHRDAPGTGCAVAALVNDMGRSQPDARALYTEQVCKSLANIGRLTGKGGDAGNDAAAIVSLSAMVGALGLARAVDNPALSAKILSAVQDFLIAQFDEPLEKAD